MKREALGVSGASPLLISVGRLSPQKGQRYLLESMVELRDQFPKIKLLIVGEKTVGQQLEILRTELGLEHHVEFLGLRHDVKEILEVADVCVFPSLFEGFPNAAVEAAAMAKPIVVTRIPPYEEVLEHNISALIVEPRSSSQLSNAIAGLARDPKGATAMGSVARDHVTSRFTISKTGRKLAELYERVHLDRNFSLEFAGTE